jgi:hypothetical protein
VKPLIISTTINAGFAASPTVFFSRLGITLSTYFPN